MSVQAISWAIEIDCPNPTSKLVLMCLANYCDKDGHAYPGQKKLAQDTGLSVSTIKRVLIALETAKLVTRKHRQRRNGSRTSDEYFLQISKVSKCDLGTKSKGSSTHDPRAHSDLPHKAKALFEPSVEPSVTDGDKSSKAIELNLIEKKLREAANLTHSPNPMFLDLSPILELMKAGLDLDREIIPVIKTVAAKSKNKKISNWNYYAAAVKNNRAEQQSSGEVTQIFDVDAITDSRWRNGILPTIKKRGSWPTYLGPTPFETNCKAPTDLIEQLKQALSEDVA